MPSLALAGPLEWWPVTTAWHDAVLLPAVRAACCCPQAVPDQGVAFALEATARRCPLGGASVQRNSGCRSISDCCLEQRTRGKLVAHPYPTGLQRLPSGHKKGPAVQGLYQ